MIPPRSIGSNTDSGPARACSISAIAPSMSSSTCWLSRCRTKNPCRCNQASRARSFLMSSCTPPSTSTTNCRFRQTKSTMKGPIGSCRLNRTPSWLRRNCDQRCCSARVGSLRMWRANPSNRSFRRAMFELYQVCRACGTPLSSLPQLAGGGGRACEVGGGTEDPLCLVPRHLPRTASEGEKSRIDPVGGSPTYVA